MTALPGGNRLAWMECCGQFDDPEEDDSGYLRGNVRDFNESDEDVANTFTTDIIPLLQQGVDNDCQKIFEGSMDFNLDYETTYVDISRRTDSRTRIGFDRWANEVLRFIVQLQYSDRYFGRTEPDWYTIAQFDHDPTGPHGHNIFEEGLHIDIYQNRRKAFVIEPPCEDLPSNLGTIIGRCKIYFEENLEYFIDIALERTDPQKVPPW